MEGDSNYSDYQTALEEEDQIGEEDGNCKAEEG